ELGMAWSQSAQLPADIDKQTGIPSRLTRAGIFVFFPPRVRPIQTSRFIVFLDHGLPVQILCCLWNQYSALQVLHLYQVRERCVPAFRHHASGKSSCIRSDVAHTLLEGLPNELRCGQSTEYR